ncbi:phage-associated protein, BcepMu gp16 family [Comamonas aquatica]|uniref:DNA-binding protein n=1 Tax=Comamonas aquatica TaxID=225991 RepID=UPI001EF359B8|nr:DNA-binding protein [Comamonas aquatica]MDH0373537.1 DNA-binding protein [Comamonas aquatica]CAB5646331.1 phage-associated protein, BcepMu gp16 family [Comamonas aquatica]CAC9169241.1 phage-associated protein, BcepMu gp16 family [Comamonas aquatica]
MLKTRQQIREDFARNGQSITAWAKARGYTPNTVIAILADTETNPRYKCLRGEAHKIAVDLGLKDGVASRPANSSAYSVPATA